MIARPLSRRTVVAGGGLVSAAALSGCSMSDVTTRKIDDPDAADRARLTQARDLSLRVLRDIEAAGSTSPALTEARALHAEQAAQFARSAGVSASPRPSVAAPTALTLTSLPDRERELAQSLRTLALQATRGDVAALLASAAAGIDQAMVR